MSKRAFYVIENVRRVTRYEVDGDTLSQAHAELLEDAATGGDDYCDDHYLVEGLVAEADEGQVVDYYLADEPDYIVLTEYEDD